MSLEYASEKLGEAVQTLATHEGTARQRVRAAAAAFALVTQADLPPELQAEYHSIWEAMTRHKSSQAGKPWDHGDVAETMSRIKNRTASKIAERIFGLDARVQSLLED